MRLHRCAQLVLLAAGSVLASHASQSSTSDVETVDLMPLYWQFWERAHASPLPEQIREVQRW